ncbi:MAG: hypothetical protein IT431_07935 [Phycisphaerales bacterium]|nr:hypothetical protein [Phycisphaerales bacterium]
MSNRNAIMGGVRVGVAVSVFLAAAASAGLCTLVKGGRGWCKDNGCAATGVHCVPILDGDLVVDCKCKARGGRETVNGSAVQIPGGGYMFDGSTLILGSLVVDNTYNYETDTQNPGDPAVGATLILPPLTAAGMKHFDDGEFAFDYYSFENTMGGPLVLDMGGSPLVIAQFGELAFFPESNAWGLLLDADRQYNNFINSTALQVIQGIDQGDPEAFPGMVLAAGDDVLQLTNGFTNAHNGPIGASNLGLEVVVLCVGDWNADGAVNTLDVLAFLNHWSAGDPIADVNGDGQVNTLDVLGFLNAWNQGCP